MAPPTLIDRGSPTVVPQHTTPPVRPSRLPARLRLIILFVLNLGLHSALLTVTNNVLGNELGAISKKPEVANDDDPAVLFKVLAPRLGYKLVVVWLGWLLNYDFIQISALTALTTVPFAYLITTLYNITPLTASMLVVNEIVAVALPTYLLRPRSAYNNAKVPVRNRYLLNSSQVQISNTLLAVGVYVSVLFSTITTGAFTQSLIIPYTDRFDNITFEGIRAENPVLLIAKLLVAGVATKAFLLNPSIGATPASGATTPVEVFDPATADLPQTFQHNFWNFSRRTRTLIRQTVVANAFILANTVQRTSSLDGATYTGAAVYSSVWILANTICGAWFVWVGGAEK